MLYYIINAVIGATLAVGISFLGKTNYYLLTALLPIFPTFTLFAHFTANMEGGEERVKQIVLFGFISTIAYVIYLTVMYFSVQQIRFPYAVMLSLSVWGMAGFYVFHLAKKYVGI